MAELIVNGFDTAALGVIVEDAPGHQDGVARRHPTKPLPGAWGSMTLALRGQAQPRRLDVNATQRASTNTQLRAWRDELLWRLGGGEAIELALPHDTTRHYVARLLDPRAISLDPAFTQVWQRLRLRFECLDPLAYTTAEDTVDFLAAATEVPLGTGPSWPTLTLTGPFTGLTVVARDHDGAATATLDLPTLEAAAGEEVVVNCRDFTITLEGANAIEHLTPASDFPVLEPWHASFAASDWPTLEVSDGGPASAVATYHKAWE